MKTLNLILFLVLISSIKSKITLIS